MKTFILLLFDFIVGFCYSYGNTYDSLTVTGVVKDHDGSAIGYASVVIRDKDSTFIAGYVANENGAFESSRLPHTAKTISISAFGYKTKMMIIPSDGMVGTVILDSDVIVLNDVVVKGHRPIYRTSKGGIMTQIKGTVLGKLGNANDVISQLPKIRISDGKIDVLGRGIPEIYINSRKVNNIEELTRLTASEIESVNILDNPGAKYGAGVKSVILIRTVHEQGDGFSGLAQGDIKMAHYVSDQYNLSINYRVKNFDIFGSAAYDHSKKYQKQRSNMDIATTTGHYVINSDGEICPKSETYATTLGFNWNINKSNMLGGRYEYKSVPYSHSYWSSSESIDIDGIHSENISYDIYWNRSNLPTNTLNMYYVGNLNNLYISINNDYYSNKNRSCQNVSENSDVEGLSNIESLNSVKNSMFASKGLLEYKLGNLSFEGGYEYTQTERTDKLENSDAGLADADDKIKENTIATFAGMELTIGKINISSGLRYEHTTSNYFQANVKSDEESRRYGHILPNVDISLDLSDVKVSLSYAEKTNRPMYYQLRSGIQYDDRFTYETGNPLLRPEYSHNFSFNCGYKWLLLSTGFQYVKDAIVGVIEPYRDNEPTNIMSYTNHGHVSKYDVSLSLSPQIGKWAPRLQLSMYGQNQKINYMGENYRLNNPIMFVSLFNSFYLGRGFDLTSDVSMNTYGDIDDVTLKPSWNFDFGMTYTKGNWFFKLSSYDIFKTARNSMISYGARMRLDKWNYADSRSLRLTVRYQFNVTSSRYKGQGAGLTEKSRL